MDIFERTDEEFREVEKVIYAEAAAENVFKKVTSVDGIKEYKELITSIKDKTIDSSTLLDYHFGKNTDTIIKLCEGNMAEVILMMNSITIMVSAKIDEFMKENKKE